MQLTGIYKITSPSGRIYIGQSIDLKQRIKVYRSNPKRAKGQTKLYNSFMKYGVENHKFEIIELCLGKYLNNMERYYQDKFDCIENGLNLRYTTTETKSGKMSKESVDKMIHYKRNLPDEVRKKLSDIRKGKPIKATMLGKNHSEETKRKISDGNKGKVRTKEHSENISNAKKGMIVSIETRVKKSKPVIQYDLDGNFIAEYYSCREATRQTGVHNGDLISVCKGKYKQAGGYKWRYKDC
jgi:group I intron endonuclease